MIITIETYHYLDKSPTVNYDFADFQYQPQRTKERNDLIYAVRDMKALISTASELNHWNQ